MLFFTQVLACLITVLNWFSLWNSEQSECSNLKFPPLKSYCGGWVGGIWIIVSALAQILPRSRLGLVRLVTRSIKARFGWVGDQVSQVKDQVGQGQGQEIDNDFILKTEDEYEKSENISIDDEDMKNETKDSSPTDSLEPSEIQSRISEILQKSDGLSTCKVCGKFGKDASNMRRHAETHIDGIVYPCTICERTFKSKNSFRVHKYSTHTTI